MMGLASAPVLFLGSLALHAALARLCRANRILLFLACGSAVGGAYLLHGLLAGGAPGLPLWRDALLFACLCEVYVILMMFSLASVSAAIVHRLHREPMTAAQIEAAYSSAEMVHSRLERLLHTGYVVARGDRLELAPKARRSVRWFDLARGFFGHDR